LDTDSCIDALNQALQHGHPTIVNSDQGSQFASQPWKNALLENQIDISMTGKGRCIDNVYIERFW
jgi:putative transposase